MEKIKELQTINKDLEKRINILEEEKHMDNLKLLEKRVERIENYLIRRARGFYIK